MKTFITGLVLAGLFLATPVGAQSFLTYNGNISPSTLGSSVTTDLPMFDSTLGTLTGVQVTLDFTVTPFAVIANYFGSGPETFTSSDSVSYSFTPSDIWTISHGSDSWSLAAPTVTTGTIYGTGQVVPLYSSLTFDGSTSAPADLTANGVNLAGYIGAGNLVFGTSGQGQVNGVGPLATSGGGDLTGTASVTYDYTPVPEPSSFGLMFGGLMLLTGTRRVLRRNLSTKP